MYIYMTKKWPKRLLWNHSSQVAFTPSCNTSDQLRPSTSHLTPLKVAIFMAGNMGDCSRCTWARASWIAFVLSWSVKSPNKSRVALTGFCITTSSSGHRKPNKTNNSRFWLFISEVSSPSPFFRFLLGLFDFKLIMTGIGPTAAARTPASSCKFKGNPSDINGNTFRGFCNAISKQICWAKRAVWISGFVLKMDREMPNCLQMPPAWSMEKLYFTIHFIGAGDFLQLIETRGQWLRVSNLIQLFPKNLLTIFWHSIFDSRKSHTEINFSREKLQKLPSHSHISTPEDLKSRKIYKSWIATCTFFEKKLKAIRKSCSSILTQYVTNTTKSVLIHDVTQWHNLWLLFSTKKGQWFRRHLGHRVKHGHITLQKKFQLSGRPLPIGMVLDVKD